MRLRLIVRDKEYCQVLMDILGNHEKDIYIELPGEKPLEGIDTKTLVVTDYNPEDFSSALPKSLRQRMVFLTTRSDLIDNKYDACQTGGLFLFKYDSLSNIVAELAQFYFNLTGEATRHRGYARMFSVCCDSDNLNSADYCRIISRQIKYRKDSRIIIIPFVYVNEYGSPGISETVSFARFMYYLQEGKSYSESAFVHEDEYGVDYLRIPIGINPISYLSDSEVNKVINTLARSFDVIICDIGTNYSAESVKILLNSEKLFLIKSYNEEYLKKELEKTIDSKSIISLDVRNGFEAMELMIDDKVCELFETEEESK